MGRGFAQGGCFHLLCCLCLRNCKKLCLHSPFPPLVVNGCCSFLGACSHGAKCGTFHLFYLLPALILSNGCVPKSWMRGFLRDPILHCFTRIFHPLERSVFLERTLERFHGRRTLSRLFYPFCPCNEY